MKFKERLPLKKEEIICTAQNPHEMYSHELKNLVHHHIRYLWRTQTEREMGKPNDG